MEFLGLKKKSNKDKSFKEKDKRSLAKELDRHGQKSHNNRSSYD